MPKDPDDIIDYDDSEEYLKDSTGTFEIEFPPYVYNVDVKINGYMDPFGDNFSSGEVELFAVFPSATPNPFADEAERHLYIDYYGVLTYEIEESSKTYSTTYFMMRNHSFPAGDDFIIDFKTDDPDEFTDFDPPVDDFLGFFGVIDKRFLDRANLCIDDGSDDWNDEDQDPISPFTWHTYDSNDLNDIVIHDSVAYSIGCQDNPEEFNYKMNDQRISINEENKVTHTFEWVTWYHTYAPAIDSSDSFWLWYTGVQQLIIYNISSGCNPPESLCDLSYKPYRPGYSSSWLAGTERFYRGQSAGVDCVGLVQRSASYDGNPYWLPDIGGHPWTWNDGDGEGGAYPYVKNRRYLFYDGDDELDSGHYPYLKEITNAAAAEWDKSVLRKILPSDIFYYYIYDEDDKAYGYHVAIVDRVEYKSTYSKRSDIKYEDIKLIEATWAPDPVIGSVINTRTLQDYENLDREWRIGRLKLQ